MNTNLSNSSETADVEIRPHSKYSFCEYQQQWPGEYQRAASEIQSVLKDELIEIHHIGSTSVPGLAAKPIIDILPIVSDINRIDQLNPLFENIGFRAWGEMGLAGRRYFTKDKNEYRTHNIHLYQQGNPAILRHLAFCAYLREHQPVMQEYAELKQRVYSLHDSDVDAYNNGKNDWIKKVEAIALTWYISNHRPV
jgi:GrpB-like predicted nucleotidyltransferase (UPF0157 family)